MPRTGLEPAHLTAHAPETCASTNSATWACLQQINLFRMWSGKRDSNPRPRPWQGRALPTELFPLVKFFRHFPKCECKVNVFFQNPQIFTIIFINKFTFLAVFPKKWGTVPVFSLFQGQEEGDSPRCESPSSWLFICSQCLLSCR